MTEWWVASHVLALPLWCHKSSLRAGWLSVAAIAYRRSRAVVFGLLVSRDCFAWLLALDLMHCFWFLSGNVKLCPPKQVAGMEFSELSEAGSSKHEDVCCQGRFQCCSQHGTPAFEAVSSWNLSCVEWSSDQPKYLRPKNGVTRLAGWLATRLLLLLHKHSYQTCTKFY